MNEELKPCPFCGSKPEYFDPITHINGEEYCCCSYLECPVCGFDLPVSVWNKRTPTIESLIAENVVLNRAIEKAVSAASKDWLDEQLKLMEVLTNPTPQVAALQEMVEAANEQAKAANRLKNSSIESRNEPRYEWRKSTCRTEELATKYQEVFK